MSKLENISYSELKVSRTYQTMTDFGFMLEAKINIDDKDKWFYLVANKDKFEFKVSGKSYFEFKLYNEDPQYYDVELYKEFNSPDDIGEEFVDIYKWLRVIGDEMAKGIKTPCFEEPDNEN